MPPAHLTRALAERYATRTLGGAELEEAERHLQSCPTCRQLVHAAAGPPSGEGSETADVFATMVEGDRPASVVDAPLPKGTKVGRYVIQERVGEGGMGLVYAAHDPELSRRVALKLLRSTAAQSEENHARLIREAQAMARLSHPNVIQVFDAGTFGDRVFLAMDFEAGPNLRRWTLARKRGWREIVQVFAQAGAGLAAAHHQDIVHRDFKPENVLVGDDGRVRITDFGLAHLTKADGEAAPTGFEDDPTHVGVAMDARLTQAGMVVGTPRYMAPEQHAGEAFDARSDQFAFCVALYEALYGHTPFAGTTREEIAHAVLRGEIREAPRNSPVPGWLRKVLLRGLAMEPADRYPSMDELLEDLSADPEARKRKLIIAAAAVAGGLIVIGLSVGLAKRQNLVCKGNDRALAGVWDETRQALVQKSFLGTGRPYAAQSFAATKAGLDRYGERLLQAREDACEATRVRKEQSEEVLSLRMECLDGRLGELRALTDLFASDSRAVDRAGQAVSRLPSIDSCADVTALRGAVKPPDAKVRDAVGPLRASLAGVRALAGSGRYKEAVAAAQPIVASARGLHWRPLEAEVLAALGEVQLRQGQLKEAEATLTAGVLAAEAAKDHAAAAAMAAPLVAAETRLSRLDVASVWASYAGALVEGGGVSDDVEATLLENRGLLAAAKGDPVEAENLVELALARAERAHGKDGLQTVRPLQSLGALAAAKGDHTRALEIFDRALERAVRTLGTEHPDLAGLLASMASSYHALGQDDRAMVQIQRAMALAQAAQGDDSPDVAAILVRQGVILRDRGEAAEALAQHRRAQVIAQRVLGPDHPLVAEAGAEAARDLARLGHPERGGPDGSSPR